MFNRKKRRTINEIIAETKPDRRLLSNVPDKEKIRTNPDRRGQEFTGEDEQFRDPEYINKLHLLSLRYVTCFDVTIIKELPWKKEKINSHSVDLSASGILVEIDDKDYLIKDGDQCVLKFSIPRGSMPEGFESNVKVPAKVVRTFEKEACGKRKKCVGFVFEKTLVEYFQKKRWKYSVYSASLFLFFSVFIVILMRMESILYFRNNIVLYTYSLITATFLLSRYLFGALYRNVKINPDFTPGVSIIIPCFNEEEWIRKTILSCVSQDYPIDKLEVIVVDDCSTDRSPEVITETLNDLYNVADRYNTRERLKAILQKKNGGKRVALVDGIKVAKHELVVFVDSDSFLEPTAIKHLVQPFQDQKMGGVTGRTDVENRYSNYLTKMQTVRYYIAFRIMKAAEAYFDCVTCLSGPLSCYKKELVLEHADEWLNQKFLGQPATFGDDRSMTNYIMKTHRTSYQDDAVCSTIVPSKTKVFLKQQMRWKRSWLRESLRASAIVYKKEPFMALFFYMGLMVPILAPIIVLYNLVYVPFTNGIFPSTFIMGFVLMSLLMSFSYLVFQKSSIWLYGMFFCIFYEFVLLWQMPVAWFTFWKSTWGTRETPEDVKYKNRKRDKKLRKDKKSNSILHDSNVA